MSSVLTGGQALIRQLVQEEVRHVFAVPGVQLDWAVDPLIDHAKQIALVVPRHEQATSYMADGYARTTGRPGVCMVVPGPGVLNAMSGLATAYACSSPVVCIAGQIASDGIGRGLGMLHEVRNQSDILGTVTKWSALAKTPADVPALVREAFLQARLPQTQPTAIEVPPDVLQAKLQSADAERHDSHVSPDALRAMRQQFEATYGTEATSRGASHDQRALVTNRAPFASAPDARAIEAAAALLSKARAPLIVAGGGVLASNASAALQSVAERIGAPVVMSENGRGSLSDHHALALPALGGRALMPHADVVLVVGSRFVTLRGLPMYENAPNAQYIYLNINEADTEGHREQTHSFRSNQTHAAGPRKAGLVRDVDDSRVQERRGAGVAPGGSSAALQGSPNTEHAHVSSGGNQPRSASPREPGLVLVGDARLGLEALSAALGTARAKGWGFSAAPKVREWCERQFAELAPQMSWLKALRAALPDDGILVNELTQNGYLATLAYPVYAPRTFITPGYQGTLGYGFPTAIGAAIGNPHRAVVSISGDGGFGWSLQELATAARYRVPVVAVVFSDGAFGNVRRIQREVFAREIGSDLHNPDFIKLADAFGVPAARINSPVALTAAIREATTGNNRGPVLLEVPVGEMPSPWHLINRFSKQPADTPPNPLETLATA